MQYRRGFSLIELMIAVAIIGIIVAVAMPSYQQHVLSTQRVMATACLTELAQQMERSYLTNMAYAQALPATSCQTELQGVYTIVLAAQTANTFQLQATPQGNQVNDKQCGVLTLDQSGQKTANAKTDAALLRLCW